MRMARHTPGPLRRDRAGGLECDVRGRNNERVALCWGLTRGNPNNPDYRARCDADANLIAATPELYDALLDAVEFLPAGPAREKAIAALAKAEGR